MARMKLTYINEPKRIKKNKETKSKIFLVRVGAWTYPMLLPVSTS